MDNTKSATRRYGLTKFLWIVPGISLIVILVLTAPAFLRIIENDRESRVRIAIEAASNICLLDQSRKSSDSFLSSVVASISKLDAQGKLERETATRSVDLAIDNEALLDERDRVRTCMKEQVPIYLAQEGLLNPGQVELSPLPPTKEPSKTGQAALPKPDAVSWQTVVPGTSAPEPVQCACLTRSLLPPPYPTPYPNGSVAQLLNRCSGEVRFAFFKHVPRQSATIIVDVLQAKTVLQPNETRTFDVSGSVGFGHIVESCTM